MAEELPPGPPVPSRLVLDGIPEKRQPKYIPPLITKSDSSVHPSYTNLVLP